MWNPAGVLYFLPIPTQCALCDTGLWSGTALQFIPDRSASITEGGGASLQRKEERVERSKS